jgi:hypothetical protein
MLDLKSLYSSFSTFPLLDVGEKDTRKQDDDEKEASNVSLRFGDERFANVAVNLALTTLNGDEDKLGKPKRRR